jgi:hypothetical protein
MKKMLMIIRDPFSVISENKSEFFIWFLFTIITGQIGIIANFIVRYYTNNTSITHSIYEDSINGSFYTFSIALVASLLGPIFINFINAKKLQFKTLKTFTIIIATFFLFITGIIYASIQSNSSITLAKLNLEIDNTQLTIYILAIAIASYGYCILRLEDSGLDFHTIDDPIFSEEDDKNVEETINISKSIKHDENGIEL